MADDYTISVDRNGNGSVICNGKELTNVVSFCVSGGVNRLTALTLKFTDVDVDVYCEGMETLDPTGNGKGH